MKEATGELNMTVIVIIAIGAVIGLFWAFVWPAIQSGIKGNTCKSWTDSSGNSYIYVSSGSGDSKVEACCPSGTSSPDNTSCIKIEE